MRKGWRESRGEREALYKSSVSTPDHILTALSSQAVICMCERQVSPTVFSGTCAHNTL